MKLIVIARHGAYSGERNATHLVTAEGAQDLRRLAESLKVRLTGHRPKILSSTANRAHQSALIVAEVLGCPIEGHEILWSDSARYPRAEQVLELIFSQEDEAVILMTHLEYTEELPKIIAHRLGFRGFPRQFVPKGEAWFINCTDGSCTRIP